MAVDRMGPKPVQNVLTGVPRAPKIPEHTVTVESPAGKREEVSMPNARDLQRRGWKLIDHVTQTETPSLAMQEAAQKEFLDGPSVVPRPVAETDPQAEAEADATKA